MTMPLAKCGCTFALAARTSSQTPTVCKPGQAVALGVPEPSCEQANARGSCIGVQRKQRASSMEAKFNTRNPAVKRIMQVNGAQSIATCEGRCWVLPSQRLTHIEGPATA